MALQKTTVLPDSNVDVADTLTRELAKSFVLFFVLGGGAEDQDLAERADGLAGDEDDECWIVWVKDPALLTAHMDLLDASASTPAALLASRGFAVSRPGRVCDWITREEVADDVRVFTALSNAEADR